MSGTRPEQDSSLLGAQNKSPQRTPPSPPYSGSKKSTRAVALNKDTVHFGFEAVFSEELQNKTSTLDQICQSVEQAEDLTDWDPKAIRETKDNILGSINVLRPLMEEAQGTFYDNRTLHGYYKKLLSHTESVMEQAGYRLEELNEAMAEKPTKMNVVQDSKDKVASKQTLAQVVAKSEEAPVENILSWADMVEEEIREDTQKEILATHQKLVSVIRSKSGLSQENRVDVPANLEEVLPLFYKKIEIASRLAKCEIVKNSKIKVELAFRDVWGSDEVARNDQIQKMYKQDGSPDDNLMAIANFGVMIDSMLEIPSIEQIALTGPGKLGVLHCIALIMRIYSEQKYSTPIAQQRNWWRAGGNIRKEMTSQIASQVGGEACANCILNCYDILYRKFIRSILSSKKEGPIKVLSEVTESFSKKMFNSGGAIFKNLLHTETRVKKVESEVLDKKKPRKVVVSQKYTAYVRPSITDGPKTPYESTLFAKVNNALAKVEVKCKDYDFASKDFDSPNMWEKYHKTHIDNLYTRVKIPSHLMVQRKQAIRATIISNRNSNQQQTGQAASSNTQGDKITSNEWKSVELAYITANEQLFDTASVKAMNDLLSTTHNKEGLLQLSEADIINLLWKD